MAKKKKAKPNEVPEYLLGNSFTIRVHPDGTVEEITLEGKLEPHPKKLEEYLLGKFQVKEDNVQFPDGTKQYTVRPILDDQPLGPSWG